MWRQEHEKFRYFLTAPYIWKHIVLCQLIEMIERMSLLSTAISWFVSLSIIWNSIFRNVGQRSHNERYKLRVLWKIMEEKHGCKHQLSGWPLTLENRENGGKNSLQGKIREFEILLKIREFQKSLILNCLFAIANLPTHFAPTQIIILLFQNKFSFFMAVSLKS